MKRVKQSYNKKIGAYVKFKKSGNRCHILDVKERMPKTPFSGVPIKKRR